jgi:beta-aspartyl-peptidase (threonine type)
VVSLEEDGRFNAGRGSALRLDGETIEMDAAVAASDGRMGAVMAVRDVRNPVLVAEAVVGLPHVALAGEGARRFARRLGFPAFKQVQEYRRRRWERSVRRVADGDLEDDLAAWRETSPAAAWNFPEPPPAPLGEDTVGAVVRDEEGLFAVATSTGGTTLALLGRVGDSPLPGCGFRAGPAGAVTPTGVGEEIIRRHVAHEVYARLADGVPAEEACREAVEAFPEAWPFGVIALAARSSGVAHNREMPWAEGGP